MCKGADIDALAQFMPAVMVHQADNDFLEGNAVQWVVDLLLAHNIVSNVLLVEMDDPRAAACFCSERCFLQSTCWQITPLTRNEGESAAIYNRQCF